MKYRRNHGRNTLKLGDIGPKVDPVSEKLENPGSRPLGMPTSFLGVSLVAILPDWADILAIFYEFTSCQEVHRLYKDAVCPGFTC